MKRLSFALLAFYVFPPILWPASAVLAADDAGLPVITWQDAGKHIGQQVYVLGKVVRTGSGRSGQVFLNFAQNYRGTLSIYLPKAAADKLSGDPKELYQGKMVKIRGKIIEHQGSPSLTISDPAIIQVVADDTPLPERSTGPQSAIGSVDDGSLPAIKPEEYIPTIPWTAAESFIGQEVFLIGQILRATSIPNGPAFLNFAKDQDTLSIFIRESYKANFSDRVDRMYKDKIIKVHGRLYVYKNKPSISVSSPAQITILPDDAKIPTEPIVPVTVAPTMTAKPGPTITIASYNVLNLFDDVDDPYRGDDATDAKPRSQLNAIAASIRKLDADVVGLVEVENRDILRVFLRALLPDMGYEAVLVEGNDDRGIDVAVLSRFPVGEVTSYQHERFPDGSGNITRFRRDLLRVRINPPGGTPFDIFVVHFKSKGGDEEGGIDARLGEARKTREVLDGILEKDPNAQFIICGDFNDEIASEPLKAILGSGSGRLTAFIDDLPANNRITYNKEPYLSMIDFILASPSMAKRYVKNSYAVHPGSPETTGSDHNPVLAKFRTK